jgi:hypothetical protein
MSSSTLNPARADQRSTSRLPDAINDLLRGGALAEHQATWLAERWPYLPDDWPSHPLLCSTGEHTRAFLSYMAVLAQ